MAKKWTETKRLEVIKRLALASKDSLTLEDAMWFLHMISRVATGSDNELELNRGSLEKWGGLE